ncbi:MAG: DUF4280 domain-containing protein [Polyangiaceae bacterium]
MPAPLTTGATLMCTNGLLPTVFVATPKPAPMIQGALAAGTIDQILSNNVPTFGMCNSPANPTVAAATSAALGVLTPMPCVPKIAAPWSPPTVALKHMSLPVATQLSKCMCAFGGSISVVAGPPGPVQST